MYVPYVHGRQVLYPLELELQMECGFWELNLESLKGNKCSRGNYLFSLEKFSLQKD